MATKYLGAGFATKGPDHLHTGGRKWTKGLAAGFEERRPDHLQSYGRRWSPKGQQQVLQQREQITYFLEAGDGHQRVSSRFCSKETRSLAIWGQEMANKGSPAGFAAKRPDHLPSEGRRWPPKGQQEFLQQGDQITYFLRAEDGHQRVSIRFCSKETRSLTLWGQEMATKGSAAGFAEKRPDHLHPEGRRSPPKGQQQVLWQRDQITYKLRAGDDHQRVSSSDVSGLPRAQSPGLGLALVGSGLPKPRAWLGLKPGLVYYIWL